MNVQLRFSPEVEEAKARDKAIVALESTIISHGMPYPENLEVASEVENTVRNSGAVPATIAILNGVIHVGLDDIQLKKLAQAKDVVKCSRRDLPYVVSRQLYGATTVAATMIIAEMAGIKVFATGGIGGVHRGAENTFDISADLPELSRTSVAVVSAGAKAILDLPKTLEYLETLGVPVIGYNCDNFPAFYTQSSGLKLALRLNNPNEVAKFLKSKWEMNLKGGVLVANPIPKEYELNPIQIQAAIEEAINSAKSKGIIGKETTPYLLKKLNEVTKGESQRANKALVLNNARVASQIAIALMHLERS